MQVCQILKHTQIFSFFIGLFLVLGLEIKSLKKNYVSRDKYGRKIKKSKLKNKCFFLEYTLMFQILGRRINWTQIGISVGDSIQYLLKRHPEIESVCIEAQEPIDLALQHIHNLAPNLAKIELISNGNIVCDFHS